MAKKYISLDKLNIFLEKLKGIFAPVVHNHSVENISGLQNELNNRPLKSETSNIQLIILEENDV